MKFCTNMYLDIRTNLIEFQGHMSKVKATGPDYRIFHHCEIGQNSLWTRQLVNRCTQLDEILHAVTLTTSRTLLNIKVIGQRSRSHGFFGVYLCA